MKSIIIIAGFAILVGGAALSSIFVGDEIVVKNEREVITNTEVVEVKELEVRIEEAQQAARADIEAKAQTAYDAVVDEEMTAIADRVKKEYITEIEATISSEEY